MHRQMPLQSTSPLFGSQLSLGSSTQRPLPGHLMPAKPPQRTGGGGGGMFAHAQTDGSELNGAFDGHGIDAVLAKPLRVENLLDTVLGLLHDENHGGS